MKTEKAIRRLNAFLRWRKTDPNDDFHEAVKLGIAALKRIRAMEHFEIGDILVFNKSYGGAVEMPDFRAEFVGYSIKVFGANGEACARVKRLDTKAGGIDLWAQGWLKKEPTNK